MPSYSEEVILEPHYTGNVVIRMGGRYYAIRQPDSGLTLGYPRANAVASLVLNPAQINPKSVTTTIASYTFKLVDLEGIVSAVVKDRGAGLIGSEVEIWLGRSGTGMDFSEYYKLPVTGLSKIDLNEQGYTFSTKETTERMNRPLYARRVRLQGDILALTTTIISKDDISKFPAAGAFRLENELIEYTAVDIQNRRFLNCGRGAFGTTPEDHEDNEDLLQAEFITDENPLDILLQILISAGGGGPYDTLTDGLGIDPALIDVAGIEALRDELFQGDMFSFALYNIESALKFIEKEILQPCNVRFTYARGNGKLTLAVLDRAQFVEDEDEINHDTMVGFPTSSISQTEIVNSVEVSYNYDEGTGKYLELATFEDDESIALYGEGAQTFKVSFKGVQDLDFVERFADGILGRLAAPSPQLTVKTRMDKSLLSIGDKTLIETNKLPSDAGDLNFANSLEVISRAINWQTGDVTLRLAYTSTTGFRLGYIAPSDPITFLTNAVGFLEAGRAARWREGWKVRLWDKLANDYATPQVNEISFITDDAIEFLTTWAPDLDSSPGRYLLKFPDYDDATPAQKRYAYVGINDRQFTKKEKAYVIVP